MLDQSLLLELEEYIELHLNAIKLSKSLEVYKEMDILESQIDVETFIGQRRKPTFQESLLNFIDSSGATDTEVYKKAELDRKHFSKIRSNTDYRPSKPTVLSLALALELSKQNTDTLLQAAGFSLSDSDTFDLIIQFCLEKEIYDRSEVNNMLDYFQVNTLN
ncbi:hypothetical protein [Paucisalibacillus sp. EB02]|uniref:hypothetical protein n=1 Tax=Paucisalibacillus sp. EB02 TaxID=1347087 RepID=UPI0004B3A6B3|nr:hypothetical protein [Paucisalibacillus sp. EB02]